MVQTHLWQHFGQYPCDSAHGTAGTGSEERERERERGRLSQLVYLEHEDEDD
jgi:hypothetical protein